VEYEDGRMKKVKRFGREEAFGRISQLIVM